MTHINSISSLSPKIHWLLFFTLSLPTHSTATTPRLPQALARILYKHISNLKHVNRLKHAHPPLAQPVSRVAFTLPPNPKFIGSRPPVAHALPNHQTRHHRTESNRVARLFRCSNIQPVI